ncbi:alpha/beta hydrolase [Herbiconiux sp.]|uniref:alpha/beta fold hydrolase n=1 Tax=Herbiconiux sp. TaxID=1871186 RepID=UPI0025BCE5FB|nr:alpha/beta hydrolase [Herbiconiux sp.]
MTRVVRVGHEADGYAPFDLVPDPARFGLDTTRVATALGDVVVRSSLRRTGTAALIMLHGAAGSWTTWTPLLAAAELRGRPLTDMVAIDLPGWGDSPFPESGRDRGVDAYARAVAEVARVLGYAEWSVVGHSLGGFIALHLAAIEPRATRGVVLVSATTFSVMRAAAHPVAGVRRMPAFVGLLAVMRAFAPGRGAASAVLRGLREIGLLRRVMAPLFARPSRVPAGVLSALADEIRPRSFCAASEEAARYRPEQHWGRIRCRVTSLRGAHDVFVRPSDDDGLRALVTHTDLQALDTAGHFAHIEVPDAVLDAVEDVARPASKRRAGAEAGAEAGAGAGAGAEAGAEAEALPQGDRPHSGAPRDPAG